MYRIHFFITSCFYQCLRSLKYKRKTDRQSWDPDRMLRAIEAVVSGVMGTFKAAKDFGVPQTTLERRVKKVRDGKSIIEAVEKGNPLF